jgi:DNA polymerase
LTGNGAPVAPVSTCAPSLVASADIPATLGAAVAELQPSMVLLLGLLPARVALGRTDPLGALRADAHQIGPAPAVVSYAPDFLLRSQASKAAAWADLCHALALVRSRCA